MRVRCSLVGAAVGQNIDKIATEQQNHKCLFASFLGRLGLQIEHTLVPSGLRTGA